MIMYLWLPFWKSQPISIRRYKGLSTHAQTVIQANKKDKIFVVDKIAFEAEIFVADNIFWLKIYLWLTKYLFCWLVNIQGLNSQMEGPCKTVTTYLRDSVDKKQQFCNFCALPKNAFCTPSLSTESIDDTQIYCAWNLAWRILDVESWKTHTKQHFYAFWDLLKNTFCTPCLSTESMEDT